MKLASAFAYPSPAYSVALRNGTYHHSLTAQHLLRGTYYAALTTTFLLRSTYCAPLTAQHLLRSTYPVALRRRPPPQVLWRAPSLASAASTASVASVAPACPQQRMRCSRPRRAGCSSRWLGWVARERATCPAVVSVPVRITARLVLQAHRRRSAQLSLMRSRGGDYYEAITSEITVLDPMSVGSAGTGKLTDGPASKLRSSPTFHGRERRSLAVRCESAHAPIDSQIQADSVIRLVVCGV